MVLRAMAGWAHVRAHLRVMGAGGNHTRIVWRCAPQPSKRILLSLSHRQGTRTPRRDAPHPTAAAAATKETNRQRGRAEGAEETGGMLTFMSGGGPSIG